MPTRAGLFSRVKEAREVLKAEAEAILGMYMENIRKAIAKGDHETAGKDMRWLLEHMPEEDGVKMVDASIDKPKSGDGQIGPSIQIGIALGGMTRPKELQAAVIDVVPEIKDEE